MPHNNYILIKIKITSLQNEINIYKKTNTIKNKYN